jgi:hydrogenase nickel incorporation protein HypA/HybF
VHEYPITQRIINIAENVAKENKATRVKEISLVVGDMSGFIGDSIQMYFDVLAKDTLVEGAKLSITYIKPKLKCIACGELFVRPKFSFSCPKCGQDGEPTDIGKEFYVKDIVVET